LGGLGLSDVLEHIDFARRMGQSKTPLYWPIYNPDLKNPHARESLELGGPMLLKKGELHRLIAHVDPQSIPAEVSQKLDLLDQLFAHATTQEASADAIADKIGT
jgi:hypothetical protein